MPKLRRRRIFTHIHGKVSRHSQVDQNLLAQENHGFNGQNNSLQEVTKERDELLRRVQSSAEKIVEYDNLKSENDKLSKKNKTLLNDVSEIKKRNLALRDNLKYLEINCDVKTHDMEKQHEIEQLKGICSKLKSENQDQKALISNLQKQLAGGKVSIDPVSENLGKVRTENQELLKEVKEAEIKIANLLTDYQNEFAARIECEKKIAIFEKQSSKNQTENMSLTKENHQIRNEFQEVDKKRINLIQSLSKAYKEKEQLEKEILDAKEKYSTFQSEKTCWEETVKTMTETIANFKAKFTRHVEANKNKSIELEKAQKISNDRQKKLLLANQENSKLQTSVDKMNQQIKALEHKNQSLVKVHEQNIQEAINNNKANFEKVISENQALLKEVKEAAIKIANLQTDCKNEINAKQEYEMKIAILEKEATKNQSEKMSLEKENHRIKNEYQEVEKKRLNLIQALSEAYEEKEQLDRDILEAKQKYSSLQFEKTSREENVKTMKETIANLKARFTKHVEANQNQSLELTRIKNEYQEVERKRLDLFQSLSSVCEENQQLTRIKNEYQEVERKRLDLIQSLSSVCEENQQLTSQNSQLNANHLHLVAKNSQLLLSVQTLETQALAQASQMSELSNAKAIIESNLQSLVLKNSELETSLQKIKLDNNNIKGLKDSMERDYVILTHEKKNLEQNCQMQKTTIYSLETKVAETKKIEQKLELKCKELAEFVCKNSKLEQKLQELKKVNKEGFANAGIKHSCELEKIQKISNDRLKKLLLANEKNTKLQTQVDKTSQEKKDLEDINQNMVKVHEQNILKIMSNHKTKLEALENEKLDLETKLKHCKEEFVKSKNAGEKDYQNNLKLKETEKNELDIKLQAMQNMVEQKDKEIGQFVEQISNLNAETSNLMKEVSSLRYKSDIEINKCNQNVRDMKDKATKLKEELDNKDKEVQKLKTELDTLTRIKSENITRNQSVDVENSQLKSEYHKLLESRNKMMAAFDNLKQEKNDILQRLKDSVSQSSASAKDSEIKELNMKYMDMIKTLKTENLILRYNSYSDPVIEESCQIRNLKWSVASILVDAVDDMDDVELNHTQMDFAFKSIYETKLQENPEGSTSIHVPNKQLREIIFQARCQNRL